MPTYVKREMVRGDSLSFQLSLLAADGVTPLDLTGIHFWFTAKLAYSDADVAAIVRLDNAMLGGISILDAINGLAQIDIPAASTAGLSDAVTKLFYDIQVRDSSSYITTIEQGFLIVYPDVTRATS